MISTVLSSFELAKARDVGVRRFNTVELKDLKASFGGATVDDQIVGAEGELAFCKGVGLKWPAYVDTFMKLPDVPPNWEVRTSRRLQKAKVAVKDPPDRLVVAVFKKSDVLFQIHGYIRAGGAQINYPREDLGQRKRPAHFVPFLRLVPLDPGFHETCAYIEDPEWGWECCFCGKSA